MAELGEGGVEGAGVPQHDGVEDEAERSELVFLAFSVALAELAALAWKTWRARAWRASVRPAHRRGPSGR